MLIIIAIYAILALFLIWYFTVNDKGPKEPKFALLLACLCGVAAYFAAHYVESLVLPESVRHIVASTANNGAHLTLSVFFLVALIEEFSKIIFLLVLTWRSSYINEITDGIIYFGLAGMFFGITESIFYLLHNGAQSGLLRAAILPFIHVGFSSVIGWLIVRHRIVHNSLPWLVLAIGTVVTMHMLYNFFLYYKASQYAAISLAIAIVFNLIVFSIYSFAQGTDKKLGRSK